MHKLALCVVSPPTANSARSMCGVMCTRDMEHPPCAVRLRPANQAGALTCAPAVSPRLPPHQFAVARMCEQLVWGPACATTLFVVFGRGYAQERSDGGRLPPLIRHAPTPIQRHAGTHPSRSDWCGGVPRSMYPRLSASREARGPPRGNPAGLWYGALLPRVLTKTPFPLSGPAGEEGKCMRGNGDHMSAGQRPHAPPLRYGAGPWVWRRRPSAASRKYGAPLRCWGKTGERHPVSLPASLGAVARNRVPFTPPGRQALVLNASDGPLR